MIHRYSKNQHGKYEIWFGNRICVEYASKREMNYFIAATNRVLTKYLIELNETYISVFSEYRRTWFLMQNVKNGKIVNQYDRERKIKSHLDCVADMFDRAGNTFAGSSDAVYSFISLAKICGFLSEAINELSALHRKRNNTIQYHLMEITAEKLKKLESELMAYPGKKPKNAFHMIDNK
jgi:hypothetical protein